MAWVTLLSLAAIVTLGVMATRWFTATSPRDLAQAFRVFLATFAALLGSGLIYAGRFGFAVAALAAAAYAVRSFRRAQAPPDPFGPAESMNGHDDDAVVRTRTLIMRLDPATGRLDGEVLEGPARGRRLERMALVELLELLEQCRRDDPESEPLIEAFLDRRHAGWRGDDERGEERATGPEPPMSDTRAYEILGLAPGATAAEVKAAHRRLMAHLHPDRGGSTYLAAQLNAARAHLLGRGGRG